MLEVIEANLTKPYGITTTMVKKRAIVLDPFDILVAVSFETGIEINQIIGESRMGHIAAVRQLYYYMAHEKTFATLRVIGNEVNRDHATVLYGHKKISEWLLIPQYRAGLMNTINRIEKRLNNYA